MGIGALRKMLEAGFERLQCGDIPMLTPEQRAVLLRPQPRRFGMAVVHRTAATLAMAACVAFALANPSLWQAETHRRSLAAVSSQVSQIVDDMATEQDSGFAPLVSLPTLGDEGDSLIQTSTDATPQPSAMCTPPTLDSDDFADLR